MEADWGQLGRQTAQGLRIQGRTGGRGIAKRVWAALVQIDRARARAGQGSGALPPSAEWLLDNWYLARREGEQAWRCLKGAGPLPAVHTGEPLIAALAQGVAGAGLPLDAPGLLAFLEGFQGVHPLTERELSLVAPALAGALVERLAGLCGSLEEDPAPFQALFTALRALSGIQFDRLLEGASWVEAVLSQDPAGLYQHMDSQTRRRYRQALCHLARRAGASELETARQVVELSRAGRGEERHVGWFLFRQPLGRAPRRPSGALYVAGVVVPTLFVVLLLGFVLRSPLVCLLLLLPVSDLVKNVVDFGVVRLFPPRPVCRMALKDGVPPEGKTLCVIAGLLTGLDSGGEYAALLERYRLKNRDAGDQLIFGLLADLPDSDATMGSEERRRVREARRAVEALNETYGGGFYLFFRPPVFHSADERYMGWERKRGALVELVRLLKGRPTGLTVRAGDKKSLDGVRYVITLDSDTSLNVGTARELIGAMLHPLNRPRIDPRRRVVTAGYGLLQPRVGVDLHAANRSWFSRLFAGQGGVDPYGCAASDVYHDLFDQATYTGKGIFDVDAFFTCLDGRFPENTILSHDLLEGSYLHAGLIGDVELTDGYPYKVSAYFARLHRWVRGDWQLLPWLGRRVRNQAGAWEPNPISPVARWKLFDNLRRSLSPVCTLLALLLGMCLARADFAAAAAAAVLAAWSNLLLSGADLLFRGGQGLRSRYHSTVIAGLGGGMLQTLVQLLLLPLHAWTCASAIAAALWRGLVTHRGRLAWVTAADAERRAGEGIWASLRRGWPCLAAGLIALCFARLPAGGAAGLVWMGTPLFAWSMSRPLDGPPATARADRPFLLHQGALIWGYFADFLGPENHWLPPDNYQEQPALGLARRTSPTNIGLALLCCLAAADLDFISREKAVDYLSHMLDTVEGLPKWRGHLYNWYDTATAQPLSPRYVSTVDGGNLCGCLIALREGLYEWGEDVLARRAEALSDAMDFSLLYDRERRLFSIGYDAEAGRMTQGWYDLMASEARQTSYLAVARGQVDPRHWRQLSRMLAGENGYSGMASWTGTMFEYFMPHLLLPVEPNSLMYESLAFCLYAQRRRTGGRAPWGISESGFYAFDGALNYQYKAHGVQALGLRRDLDAELVVAPYASFLALLLAPGRAGDNLRALRDLGAEGKYGLYEALDYTPARLAGEKPFEVVRSYMAHHLGMSLLAIDNALNDNVMQRRFMRDRDMGAFRELLQEKVPVGAAVMKSQGREVPDPPRRLPAAGLTRAGVWEGEGRPDCHLVSNGAYSVFCTAAGTARERMGDTQLTTDLGVRFYLSTPDDLVPLTPGPWRFDAGASWQTIHGALTALHHLQVPDRENGSLRTLTLDWQGEGPLCGELVCYLEPVLARREDYLAHPAFSKLFVESACAGDGVVFTRRPRSRREGHPSLAVCWDAPRAFFDTSREQALGRGGLAALRQALARPASSSAGAVLDPCLLCRIPFSLAPGEGASFRFALAGGDGAEAACQAARRLLDPRMAHTVSFSLHAMAACHLSGDMTLQVYRLMACLVYPRAGVRVHPTDLWPYGISGDLPIALIGAAGRTGAENASVWLGVHKFLRTCGFAFDLVLLLEESGDYRRPGRSALTQALEDLDWAHMLGGRGGVHLVEGGEQLRTAAAVDLDTLWQEQPPKDCPAISDKLNTITLELGSPRWEFAADGSFRLLAGRRLPPVGWSMILTNGRLGWMPDETGCGHLWLDNAREGLLTPWINDPLAVGGSEGLFLVDGEERRSLFAAGDGLDRMVTYSPGFARWETSWGARSVKLTTFIPMEEDIRFLLVELEGPPCHLLYQSSTQGNQLYKLKGTLALATTAEGTALCPDLGRVRKGLNRTVMHWNRQVSALHLHTPDEALNQYLNGWALYQVIACRLLGRTSRYQSGGAYGFRDQLQDVCAALLAHPGYAREQILRCCAHQYREGDVQHWWHELPGQPHRGVRTRVSDDLLWLPYTLCVYVEATGDWGLLREEAPYLDSPPLAEGEEECYEQAAIAREMGRVYHHAAAAIDCFLRRGVGTHGLPLMGTGDWNDGMNRVGAAGRGESVWLAWFAAHVLHRFAPLCEGMGEASRAERCRRAAAELVRGAEGAWDGDWYLRGYYDDGSPLGGRACSACQMDSIAQSWAALAPGAHRERALTGVRAAVDRLFDRASGVVRLFAPPFDGTGADPGYIAGYVPGIRENGGQYTHGAVWLALACLRLGMAGEGYALLRALLPGGRDSQVYRAEPYVLCADVYANPAHLGRGGWSWYTGAAGWFYRTAVEELLGLRLRAGVLTLDPRLPPDWPGYTAQWRREGAVWHITVRRGDTPCTYLDSRAVEGGIPLDGQSGSHTIECILPPD